jgi:glutamate-ammonia-ligase adenylyltransferase
MRLRPNGDSGPLVASFDMLENYFITQGREWERYAWIKARVMTGIRSAELADIARPFIFRKYLDFGAINAMRDLHAQIRREVARKDMAHNVKLGPGGIREIEFLAQVFQLIRGGRDTSLQIKPTLKVLDRLAERGIITREAEQQLAAAYDFLRRVEHRLQYLDDAQTHNLPGKPDDQAIIARGMGFASYEALLSELDTHREIVGRHFDSVFGDPTEAGHSLDELWSCAADEERSAEEFRRLGYPDAPPPPAASPPPARPLPADAAGHPDALRPADPAGHRGRRRNRRPQRHLRAPARPARRHQPARLLPGAAAAVPADRAQGGRAGQRLELGRPVPQPPPDPPRRSPRPAPARGGARLPAFRAELARSSTRSSPTWNARWT